MNEIKKPRVSTDLAVMALFVILGVSMIWNTARVIYRNYDLQQQVNALQAEIDVLAIQNQNLSYNIEYYQTDTYLELEAREKFNKAKSGEKLALLPRDLSFEAGERTGEQPVQRAEEEQSNLSAWIEFLFGRVN